MTAESLAAPAVYPRKTEANGAQEKEAEELRNEKFKLDEAEKETAEAPTEEKKTTPQRVTRKRARSEAPIQPDNENGPKRKRTKVD